MTPKGIYNLLAKCDKEHPYIIYDFVATKLSKKEFEKLRDYSQHNKDLLGEYRFIPYQDTDFSWWGSVKKYLTKRHLYHNQYFEIDYWGYVTRY